MLRWLRGNNEQSTGTGYFGADLVKKEIELARARTEQKIVTQRVARKNKEMLKGHALRERIAPIARRNKPRLVLVITTPTMRLDLVRALMRANTKARYFYADSVADARDVALKNRIEMVYIVTSMDSHDLTSPCFFSTTHPDDEHNRAQFPSYKGQEEEVREFCGDAEIIMVCGASGDCCPIASQIETFLVEDYDAPPERMAV